MKRHTGLWLIGAILVVSGTAKAVTLIAARSAPPPTQLAVAVGELAMAVWLVSGWRPGLARAAAFVGFSAFLGTSLVKAFAGEESCDCFGDLTVSPWFTVVLDAAILLGLGLDARWHGMRAIAGEGGLRLGVGLAIVAGLAGAGFAWRNLAVPMTDDGTIDAAAKRVVLAPADWVGKRLPLLPHIDIGPKLGRGDWIVMLYHWQCDGCRRYLPQYVGLARSLADVSGGMKLALVELPPLESDVVGGGSSAVVRGRLSPAKTWVVRLPHFLRLHDGIVDVATDAPEDLLQYPTAAADGRGRVRPPAQTSGPPPSDFPDYRQIRRNAYLSEIACGPLALLAVLQNLGVGLSVEEAERLLDEAGDRGTDMLSLRDLARRHGLHGLGVAVTPRRLRQLGQHAIVHLNGVGFAAVTGFEDDGVRVVYPLRPPGVIPDDLFEKSFGDEGRALLLSRAPLDYRRLGLDPPEADARTGGPRLQLATSMVTAGRVFRQKWYATLQLTNVGDAPLAIEGVKASCPSCFTASVDATTVPPGGATTLRLAGTADQLGGFLHSVELSTNQPNTKVVRVPVRGYVEQPVGFEKPALMLKNMLPGQSTEAFVNMDIPKAIAASNLRVSVPDSAPLEAAVREGPDGRISLSVRWKGFAKVGWHHYRLSVRDGLSDDAVPAPFHVAVEVVPALSVFPASAVVSDTEAATKWQRRFTVVARGKSTIAPEIWWDDSSLQDALSVRCHPERHGTWTVCVEPSAVRGGQPLRRKATLTVRSPLGESRVTITVGDRRLMTLLPEE
ncbi:MAG: DUF1573 domain-containing protein [Gemmataceae bacterium]